MFSVCEEMFGLVHQSDGFLGRYAVLPPLAVTGAINLALLFFFEEDSASSPTDWDAGGASSRSGLSRFLAILTSELDSDPLDDMADACFVRSEQ